MRLVSSLETGSRILKADSERCYLVIATKHLSGGCVSGPLVLLHCLFSLQPPIKLEQHSHTGKSYNPTYNNFPTQTMSRTGVVKLLRLCILSDSLAIAVVFMMHFPGIQEGSLCLKELAV